MKKNCLLLVLLLPLCTFAHISIDSLPSKIEIGKLPHNEDAVIYKKPKPFSFFTNIPKDVAGYTAQSFKKIILPKLAVVAGATGILLLLDHNITNEVQKFASHNHITAKEQFSPFIKLNIGGKQTNIGKIPKNFNTAFYNLGQGSSTMFLAAGFFLEGKIRKDNRALQTAKQLIESFLALGAGTQGMKYATGRENPCDATLPGGRWHPFPSYASFQNNKPKYDAFPSGHLATIISAVTVIAENYPEKRWIRPLG